jgi:hypothetical protein
MANGGGPTASGFKTTSNGVAFLVVGHEVFFLHITIDAVIVRLVDHPRLTYY